MLGLKRTAHAKVRSESQLVFFRGHAYHWGRAKRELRCRVHGDTVGLKGSQVICLKCGWDGLVYQVKR